MRIDKLLAIIAAFIILTGCGSNSDPIRTSDDAPSDEYALPELWSMDAADAGNHMLWGYYSLDFDPETLEIKAVPDRGALAHWNVTGLISPPACNDCLAMKVVGHDPATHSISVQVSIGNRTPLTGFDVRGILLPKVGSIRLMNADSFINLWSSGALSARNPFLAFARSCAQRAFPPGAGHSRTYEIIYDNLHNLGKTSYAIDVSWPDNCREPYEIILPATPKFVGQDPTTVEIQVLDWQDDVEWVVIYPYPLTLIDYSEYIMMSHLWGDTWSVTFKNVNKVSPGSYFLWIQAKSADTDIVTWHRLQMNVQDPPPGPKDIQCRFYVATDADGLLPYYEDPLGFELEFTYEIAATQRDWANLFWNQYGFNLVDDGTYRVMNDEIWYDWEFFELDDFEEILEMHQFYGRYYTPGALSMYFVQGFPAGPQTAFVTWPEWVDTLAEHKPKEVFMVFGPNVWFWQEAMAHECGHAIGALEDIYLLYPAIGYDCEALEEDRVPKFQYLYCDDDAYYAGNLMWYAMGWSIDEYDLTRGQAEWVLRFHEQYPHNW